MWFILKLFFWTPLYISVSYYYFIFSILLFYWDPWRMLIFLAHVLWKWSISNCQNIICCIWIISNLKTIPSLVLIHKLWMCWTVLLVFITLVIDWYLKTSRLLDRISWMLWILFLESSLDITRTFSIFMLTTSLITIK